MVRFFGFVLLVSTSLACHSKFINPYEHQDKVAEMIKAATELSNLLDKYDHDLGRPGPSCIDEIGSSLAKAQTLFRYNPFLQSESKHLKQMEREVKLKSDYEHTTGAIYVNEEDDFELVRIKVAGLMAKSIKVHLAAKPFPSELDPTGKYWDDFHLNIYLVALFKNHFLAQLYTTEANEARHLFNYMGECRKYLDSCIEVIKAVYKVNDGQKILLERKLKFLIQAKDSIKHFNAHVSFMLLASRKIPQVEEKKFTIIKVDRLFDVIVGEGLHQITYDCIYEACSDPSFEVFKTQNTVRSIRKGLDKVLQVIHENMDRQFVDQSGDDTKDAVTIRTKKQPKLIAEESKRQSEILFTAESNAVATAPIAETKAEAETVAIPPIAETVSTYPIAETTAESMTVITAPIAETKAEAETVAIPPIVETVITPPIADTARNARKATARNERDQLMKKRAEKRADQLSARQSNMKAKHNKRVEAIKTEAMEKDDEDVTFYYRNKWPETNDVFERNQRENFCNKTYSPSDVFRHSFFPEITASGTTINYLCSLIVCGTPDYQGFLDAHFDLGGIFVEKSNGNKLFYFEEPIKYHKTLHRPHKSSNFDHTLYRRFYRNCGLHPNFFIRL